MSILRIAVAALALAAAARAQTFVQMTDTQFGMFTGDKGFEHETANFEFAVASANRIMPAFVIVTGDLVNQGGNAAEIAEFKRIEGRLDPAIRAYHLPGNHDAGNSPTAATLARYREQLGPDYYAFRAGGIAAIVLDSTLEKAGPEMAQEAAKMEAWLERELARARQDGVRHIIVFQHHPFFMKDPQERDLYDNVPLATRLRYLKILKDAGVRYVFAGHTHYNVEARDGDLQVIATAPVGKPLNGGKSGFRVVTVTPEAVTHKFVDFGDLP